MLDFFTKKRYTTTNIVLAGTISYINIWEAFMYLLLWIFFVYAFLGWCTEVSYAALVTGRFVNRGFLNGPWCPVYGF